jgi:hypothetical protein
MQTDSDDEAWRQLVDAGRVPEPPTNVYDTAYATYLHMASAAAGQSTPRRSWVLVAASVAVVALGGSILVLSGNDNDSSTGLTGAPSPSPVSKPTSLLPTSSPRQPTETLNGGSASSSQVAYFAAPTFERFTRTAYVANVAEGTVERATPHYIEGPDDGAILTELRVQIARSRDGRLGTVSLFQTGGTVPKRLLKRQLEKKFGKLSHKQLEGFVEERRFGQLPPRAGDRILFAIGKSSVKPAPSIVATLIAGPEETYAWQGAPPNRKWSPTLSRAEVDRLFQPE